MSINRTPTWLDDTHEDLQDLPAWLLAGVLALGLLFGVLVAWIGG